MRAETQTPEKSTSEASSQPGHGGDGRLGALAAPGLVLLGVVCCAGPFLVASLLATGAGAWLAGHGYLLGAVALFVIAVVFVWRLHARMSRR
jgi:hypothetical protein